MKQADQHVKQNLIWLQILKLFIFNIWAILVLSSVRLLFYKLYSVNENFEVTELMKALFLGVRFDQVIISYFNFIYLLMFIILRYLPATPINIDRKILSTYSLILTLITFTHIANVYYYGYFQDHFNVLIYGFIHDDTIAVLQTMWSNYPVVKISIAMIALYYVTQTLVLNLTPSLSKKLNQKIESKKNIKPHYEAIALILIFIVNAILARGSVGLFPLGAQDTVISQNNFINQLSYNGSHALFKTIQLRQKNNKFNWDSNAEFYGYKNNLKKAVATYFNIPEETIPPNPLDLLKRKTPLNTWAAQTKPHVVLIVMEGFGAYWMRFHSPQFNLLGQFEKHLQEDFVMTKFLPATGATIGSIGALMINSPHRPDSAFLTEGEYLNIKFNSSPAQTYKKQGYETTFLYGGNTGWRDIGKFAKAQGFDMIESQVNVEKSLGRKLEHHDWGIYDGDLFEHILIKLKTSQKPQFVLVLTTTNHPPYQLPSNYQKLEQTIPNELSQKLIGDLEINKSRFLTYQYSNQKLGELLSSIKTSTLKDNTILAATGDHSFYLVQFEDKQILEKWSVPFYIYTPTKGRKNIPNNLYGAHPDILPTLYDLSLSEAEYESLSSSLLDPKRPNLASFFSRFVIDPTGVCFAGRPGQESYLRLGENDLTENQIQRLKQNCHIYGASVAIQDYYFKQQKSPNQ